MNWQIALAVILVCGHSLRLPGVSARVGPITHEMDLRHGNPSKSIATRLQEEDVYFRGVDPLLSLDIGELEDDPLHQVGGLNEFKGYYEQLREHQTELLNSEVDSLKMLDPADFHDKLTLQRVFRECEEMYYHVGVVRPCVIECHPPVDCKAQAETDCSSALNHGGEINLHNCLVEQETVCERSGRFDGTQFPIFERWYRGSHLSSIDLEAKEMHKPEKDDLFDYCGSLFQLRGLKPSCLIECSVFHKKYGNPSSFVGPLQGNIPSQVTFDMCLAQAMKECDRQTTTTFVTPLTQSDSGRISVDFEGATKEQCLNTQRNRCLALAIM